MSRMTRTIQALALAAPLALAACGSNEKKCEDFCGSGSACVSGTCIAVEQCSPTCGAGEICQGTGAGASCVALLSSACTAGCAAGQVCLTDGVAAQCTDVCGSDSTFDSLTGTCVPVSEFHATSAALAGPFTSGYQVSAACTGCHPQQAADVMTTLHWTWKGPTPQLQGLVDFQPDGLPRNPGDIGKQNLVNNFCVAVPSNEKRCDQCHAGYGGDPDPAKPQKSARAYTSAAAGGDSSIPLEQRVDCLVCHSDPVSGYAKDPKNFGNPLATVDLARSARLVRRVPTRQNCGVCHFYAGGGDNVKLMGSALRDPDESVDVHMGRKMHCAGCHAEPGHNFKGAGIHTPANWARASCEECHGATPHAGKFTAGATIDRHTDAIACQTCHIPTFARAQFAKMNWDWSTLGDKSRGTNGVETAAVNDLGQPDPAGTSVVVFDYIKGDFLWQRNVKPAYAWYNGGMTHVTAMDKGSFTVETGLTTADADRITLGMPLGGPSDPAAKIHPFKLMRGRQPVYVDGASSFVVVPSLFGPAGMWGIIQSAGYTYDPATGNYTAPNAAVPVVTPTPLADLWGTVLANGAIKAGQVPSGTPAFARWDGVNPGYDWRYTKLYMDLNHEVAPKGQAFGAAGCGDCHSPTPVIDFQALGYACGDPMGCPKRP